MLLDFQLNLIRHVIYLLNFIYRFCCVFFCCLFLRKCPSPEITHNVKLEVSMEQKEEEGSKSFFQKGKEKPLILQSQVIINS